jgi:septal ring factor EnvC (AmiA/AmiB activator)
MDDWRLGSGSRAPVIIATAVATLLVVAGGVVAVNAYDARLRAVELEQSSGSADESSDAASDQLQELTRSLDETRSELAETRRRLKTATKDRDTARSEADQADADLRRQQDAATAVRTPCQQMFAAGVPFAQAYYTWSVNGAPSNWDADRDGIPCENSYGERIYVP